MGRNLSLSLTFIILLGGINGVVSADYQMGIDVSKWQGSINWTQVHNSGISFAFVKATEGVGYTDPTFLTNVTGSSTSGITTGVYHMSTPVDDINDAIAEANYFVSIAGDYMTEGYIRPVLDLERGYAMGRTALSAWACAFMTQVETLTGIEPLIYCNQNYAVNYFDSSVGEYDVWFARWTYDTNVPPTIFGVFDDWDFWQYSDDTRVAGIAGAVDGDVCRDVSPYVIPSPNTAPVARRDYYRVHVSDILDVSAPGVLRNDTDTDGDSLTAVKAGYPSHGDLDFYGNGSFTYDPDAFFRGVDTFTYQASDGIVLSNAVTVSITVYNNAPTAVGDVYNLNANSFLVKSETLGLKANDVDIDGDSFSVFLQDDVEHGFLSLNMNGSFNYFPEIGFVGVDQFTYYATDGWDASKTATVTFNVLPVYFPGDANFDGRVDGLDVTILTANWQVQIGATWEMGDFNADGKVDGSDVTILAGNWQKNVNVTAASVPEPGAVVLLFGMLAGLAWIRHSKSVELSFDR